jgi:putative redox protein
MFRAQSGPLARVCTNAQRCCPQNLGSSLRRFSYSPAWLQRLPVHISGQGSGTIQTLSVKDKPFKFSTDAYTVLGGNESHPSPIAYSLASLSSCNQVTGFVVAKDHGIKLGEWHVTVEGQLPTSVFVGGEKGNSNWESVNLKVRVQSDIQGGNDNAKFQHFAKEVERRCPMTALFKRSGLTYTSEWINEPL